MLIGFLLKVLLEFIEFCFSFGLLEFATKKNLIFYKILYVIRIDKLSSTHIASGFKLF